MAKTNRKHDRIIHYEATIQRMRFSSLFDVYNFMADIVGFAEDNEGHICMEEMMSMYRACPSVVEVSYDYDNSEKWGLSLDSLQHVGIYKAPTETGEGYYLVIRGVENMEALKNE